jgi:hypothetical protein
VASISTTRWWAPGAADPGQGRALLGGHAREVGLDVGDAIAVVAGEAPAARRQPTGDLDHLTDLAAIDRGAELGVDQVVPREEQAVEVGLAGGAQELVGGREGAVEEPPPTGSRRPGPTGRWRATYIRCSGRSG